MPFNPNIPQPTDLLSTSQVDLLNNNGFLDSVFVIDHYTFSDPTIDAGKHNTVTTPNVHSPAGHPATVVGNPKIYGMQDSANIGVIQYSRGPNSAPPTPLTTLQSLTTGIPLAPGAATNVLDLTGLTFFYGIVMACDLSNPPVSLPQLGIVSWNGPPAPIGLFQNFSTISSLSIGFLGNIIIVKNTGGVAIPKVYWTLQMLRINT